MFFPQENRLPEDIVVQEGNVQIEDVQNPVVQVDDAHLNVQMQDGHGQNAGGKEENTGGNDFLGRNVNNEDGNAIEGSFGNDLATDLVHEDSFEGSEVQAIMSENQFSDLDTGLA